MYDIKIIMLTIIVVCNNARAIQLVFDYLYWRLTVLSLINFCAFLYSAHKYKYREAHKFEIGEARRNQQREHPLNGLNRKWEN
jgi:hypothetical protein